MKALALIAGLAMTCGLAHANDCIVSPQCALADEYIREIREIQDIQDDGQAEIKTAKNPMEQMADYVHTGSALILAMRTDISMLNEAKTNPDTVKYLVGLYEAQIQLYQRLIEISA